MAQVSPVLVGHVAAALVWVALERKLEWDDFTFLRPVVDWW
ncbi:hypothetical protein ABZ464_51880 [Streptomyces sp. NPDC005820]